MRKNNILIIAVFFLLNGLKINAQNIPDTAKFKRLFQPQTENFQNRQTDRSVQDSIRQTDLDSIARIQHKIDSLNARLKFIQDSIAARQKFIADSLEARRKFVRDSIRRRKRILDSLNFLKRELPKLLEASIKTFSNDIIIWNNQLVIVGDSTLNDFEYRLIPFKFNEPFTPWKSSINLTTNPVKIATDKFRRKITSIQAKQFNCVYEYQHRSNIVILHGQGIIVNRRTGSLYKIPLDSIFFNQRGNVTKIKRYHEYYKLTSNYQKGPFMFLHLAQVKQYEYNLNKLLTNYEISNFCERTNQYEEHKVCNIINYSLNITGTKYVLTKKHTPENKYADGTFTYEFDYKGNFRSVAYYNSANKINYKIFIELNEDGNISRYVYQENGKVNRTLLINYYLNNPMAKHKVETITCNFEDDGICYYQMNNTTNKSRVRDKMTLEWGPWK